MTRALLPFILVALFILVTMLAQGIGQSVGHGLTEWSVR
jgi:hypothetical protein